MTKANSKRESFGHDEEALAVLQAHFESTFDAGPLRAADRRKEPKVKVIPHTDKKSLVDGSGVDAVPGPSKPKQKAKISVQEPETVVFDGSVGRRAADLSSLQSGGWRKFMSNKVATSKDKFDEDAQKARIEKQKKKANHAGVIGVGDVDEEEEEKVQMTNDRALSQLLSSTLFAPESQETRKKSSNGTPVLSSNATLSRIMELSQPTLTADAKSVGRGLGNSLLRANELGKIPANMRHGIRKAQKEKQTEDVEKAKELGIYHQSIKGLLGKGAEGADLVQGSRDKDKKARSRQKGLSMGVGRFSNGALRLSNDEVRKINESGSNRSAKRRKQ